MSVTIKNYNKPNGFSTEVFTDPGTKLFYNIIGPMGKGIRPLDHGTHIAFTAGTGCLVFVDLVAHLLKRNLGTFKVDSTFDDTFKFVFFVSFLSSPG